MLSIKEIEKEEIREGEQETDSFELSEFYELEEVELSEEEEFK